MVLVFAGALLIALGLFAGTVLVLAPLQLVPWSPGLSLWVLFPLLSILGYVLFVIGGRAGTVRTGSLVTSCLLLLLALGAAAGLVLQAASVLAPETSTLALWYVLAVAGMLGVTGAASLGQRTAEAAA